MAVVRKMPIKHAVGGTKGLIYLFRGFRLIISDWRLFKLSIMPFMVNAFLFLLFVLSFNTLSYHLSTWIFDQSTHEWYWAVLSWGVGIIMFLGSLLVVVFGFVVVGLIIASPFNDILSSAVEEALTGQVTESDQSYTQMALFVMKNETKQMTVFVLCEIALVMLNIIPMIGQIAFAILNPLFIAFVMAYEFTGYPLDRRGLGYAEKKEYLFTQTGMSFGFGGVIGLTFLFPILYFVLMPAAVAGGTMFVVENAPTAPGPDKLEST